MKDLLHEQAVAQGLAVRDAIDSTVLLPTELARSQKTRFAKTVTINGVKHTLESDSPEGLVAEETNLYRSLMAQQTEQQSEVTEQPAEPLRDSAGRFVSPNDAAVEEYLQRKGIDPVALQQVSEKKFEQSWKAATDAFISAHPDWQGGQENLNRMGQMMLELGLENDPSVQSLERAYSELQRQNLIAENPEIRAAQDYETELAACRTAEEIRVVNHKYCGGSSSPN